MCHFWPYLFLDPSVLETHLLKSNSILIGFVGTTDANEQENSDGAKNLGAPVTYGFIFAQNKVFVKAGKMPTPKAFLDFKYSIKISQCWLQFNAELRAGIFLNLSHLPNFHGVNCFVCKRSDAFEKGIHKFLNFFSSF